jgi:hypothetical protein
VSTNGCQEESEEEDPEKEVSPFRSYTKSVFVLAIIQKDAFGNGHVLFTSPRRRSPAVESSGRQPLGLLSGNPRDSPPGRRMKVAAPGSFSGEMGAATWQSMRLS